MSDPSKTIHKLTAENAALKKKIEELQAADTEIKLRYAYEQLRAQYDSLVESDRSLRKNEEKLKSIFRVAPTGIGVVSDRILIEVNSKICAMTGYSLEELVGRSSRIFYPSQKSLNS